MKQPVIRVSDLGGQVDLRITLKNSFFKLVATVLWFLHLLGPTTPLGSRIGDPENTREKTKNTYYG